MLTKIKRQECLSRFPQFPIRVYNNLKKDHDYFYPSVNLSYVLTLPGKSFRSRITSLGNEIAKTVKKLGYNNLIFLGDENIPWLYRSSDFKPVKAALDYLVENKVGKRFDGALQLEISQIPVFIKHLAWLTRCNAILPYVYFTDSEHNIIGHVCQYGNLHISILNSRTEKLFKSNLEDSKFELLIDTRCA